MDCLRLLGRANAFFRVLVPFVSEETSMMNFTTSVLAHFAVGVVVATAAVYLSSSRQ